MRMFDPRPKEPTPLHNRILTERCPWKCDQCNKVHESLDDPGVRVMREGRIQRICWNHIRGVELDGYHDGE